MNPVAVQTGGRREKTGDAMKDSLALSPRLAFLISVLLSLMLGVVDWASGYELQFFVFYFIPISLAGWNCGLARTLTISTLCGGLWISIDVYSGHPYSNWFYTCWSAIIRIASFLLNGYSVVRIKGLLLAKQQATADLRQTLAEAKALGVVGNPAPSDVSNSRAETASMRPGPPDVQGGDS